MLVPVRTDLSRRYRSVVVRLVLLVAAVVAGRLLGEVVAIEVHVGLAPVVAVNLDLSAALLDAELGLRDPRRRSAPPPPH
jgi:hypothetical protein